LRINFEVMIREISLRQFNAYCYSRLPYLRVFSNEVAWFEAFDKKLLAVIVYDYSDVDYGFVILGRDELKTFRAVELPDGFYETKEEAIARMKIIIQKFENDGKQIYAQQDEKGSPNEILKAMVEDEKLHRYFKIMTSGNGYEAAANMIREIAYSYIDVDGNYIKDFQTTGFDARLWELYLYIYLHVTGFSIDRSFKAPDFVVNYFGAPYTIEAVTVNANPSFDEPPPKNGIEAIALSRDYMPIKFGSPLYTKLKKKYWEQPHVKCKPFIIAIHDFHMAATLENFGSMTWSRTALTDYLYGNRMKYKIGEDGSFAIETTTTENGVEPINESIEFHEWKDKKIPSNFFAQPDAENISAVLFTNNATLTTFNRMGKLAGLGGDDIKMLRHRQQYNPDPFATEPIFSLQDVDAPDYEESWEDGLIMFHNPNAKFPVDRKDFPNITHLYFDIDAGQIYGYTKPYTTLASVTEVFMPGPNS
jgi:hypothetical protein